MKKCKKYSFLIYKEADGLITEKEKKLLEEHIRNCNRCSEEYKLIIALKNELKENDTANLPDNFQAVLRKKLVEYNMNKPTYAPFYKRPYVNLAATLCLALGITIFAVNNNAPDLKNLANNDLEITQSLNQAENKDNHKPETEAANARTINNTSETKKSTEDTEKTTSVTTEEQHIQENRAKNSSSLSSANSSKEQSPLADSSYSKINSLYDTKNSFVSTESNDASVNILNEAESAENKYIVITVNDFASLSELVPFAEKNEDNTYFVSMDKFDEVKELLKDYNMTVENENDETLKKDKFIIK